MVRKDDNANIKDALQSRDIDDIKKGFNDLGVFMKEGFKGVHDRQDTANGKLLKNEANITALSAEFKYNRIIWYLFTVSVTLIVALVSYILFK